MRRILKSILGLGILGLVIFGVTQAFFNDEERSKDNQFTAGQIDLKIDHIKQTYLDINCETANCILWTEKDLGENDLFWNFDDLKPGDRGTNVISIHVLDNDYYICLLSDKYDLENMVVEPEIAAKDFTDQEGELSSYIEVFIWNDLDNDGVYDPVSETSISQGELFDLIALNEPPNPPWTASTIHYLGITWCFGNQTINHDTGAITCNGYGDQNDTQTDTLAVNLKFYVEQSRNNPEFSCAGSISKINSLH